MSYYDYNEERERYDEFIERRTGMFADDCRVTDDWGGFETRELARQRWSFEDWKDMGEPY